MAEKNPYWFSGGEARSILDPDIRKQLGIKLHPSIELLMTASDELCYAIEAAFSDEGVKDRVADVRAALVTLSLARQADAATMPADVATLVEKLDDWTRSDTSLSCRKYDLLQEAIAYIRRPLAPATRPSAPAGDVAMEIANVVAAHIWGESVGVPGELPKAKAALATLIRPHVTGDCPEADATDYAHPAWWRGHNYTVEVFCRMVNDIIDGKKSSKGISGEPWESTKRRLFALAATASGEQWRPIETAPKDGTRILGTVVGLENSTLVYFWNRLVEEWRVLFSNGLCTPPTHFMPLPPAPATAEQGEKGGGS